MHLLGISGSLRGDSLNGRLLAAGLAHAPDTWSTATYDELRHVPPFDMDAEEPAPEAVQRLRAAIAEADAILFATPEYNSSIPGQLKNALDWTSRPFATNALRNRPVAVVSASDGLFGGVWAAAELRKVLARIGARVVDADLGVPEAHTAFGPDGSLLDPELDARLAAAVATLAAEVRPVATPV